MRRLLLIVILSLLVLCINASSEELGSYGFSIWDDVTWDMSISEVIQSVGIKSIAGMDEDSIATFPTESYTEYVTTVFGEDAIGKTDHIRYVFDMNKEGGSLYTIYVVYSPDQDELKEFYDSMCDNVSSYYDTDPEIYYKNTVWSIDSGSTTVCVMESEGYIILDYMKTTMVGQNAYS